MSVLLSDKARFAIKNRISWKADDDVDPWAIAYTTKGGSYIVASNGKQSDSQKPRDLVLVTPDSEIVVLTPLVNPDFATAVQEALR